MTIQEAIKTGKPFIRKGIIRNYYPNPVMDIPGNYWAKARGWALMSFTREDLMANDWCIKVREGKKIVIYDQKNKIWKKFKKSKIGNYYLEEQK